MVSSAFRERVAQDNNLSYVRIESEKGKECVVANPWPGQTVQMSRNGVTTDTITGDLLTILTRAGEVLYFHSA